VRALVTGCTGSLGSALVPLLLLDGHEVVGVSRCELKQSLYPKHEKLTLYLCDVRDRDRLLEASRNVDIVFHLAAMKRIEACEQQPEEAVSINVKGTENVLFCQRMNKIPRVVLVSTDKACEPITSYGYTKALAENLVLRNPNNVVVRYGNVLASRGSVVGIFKNSILERGEIEVTERRCTRFWWTLDDAAKFVYRSAQGNVGGLRIPNLRASSVVALGKAIGGILQHPNPRIVETGFRCREKLHETMRTDDEGGLIVSSDQSLWYSQKELENVLREVIA